MTAWPSMLCLCSSNLFTLNNPSTLWTTRKHNLTGTFPAHSSGDGFTPTITTPERYDALRCQFAEGCYCMYLWQSQTASAVISANKAGGGGGGEWVYINNGGSLSLRCLARWLHCESLVVRAWYARSLLEMHIMLPVSLDVVAPVCSGDLSFCDEGVGRDRGTKDRGVGIEQRVGILRGWAIVEQPPSPPPPPPPPPPRYCLLCYAEAVFSPS